MRNPWRRFKSVPLGQIFSQYGGGGHQRVASVLLKDIQEAQRTLGSILKDLRTASFANKPSPKEAIAGD
jgi:nanoRNase/pAp phosphatase (c-di-AMP/oligoRNAs hydrolase)